jgi:DNA-binding NarL/FixJ family response regulator
MGRATATIVGMRLMVVEDSLLVRRGLVTLLTGLNHVVAAEAVRADHVLGLVGRTGPDVVLMDVRIPPTRTDEGVRLAVQIRRRYPAVGVLVLAQDLEPAYADTLLATGTTRIGYLLKDRVLAPSDLNDALARIQAGQVVIDEDLVTDLMRRRSTGDAMRGLTDRERDLLALIAQGFSDRGIAGHLTVSLATVETHVRNIYRKLHIADAWGDNRRVGAVLAYLRHRGQPDGPSTVVS